MANNGVRVLLLLFFYINCIELALISSCLEPSIFKHGGEIEKKGGGWLTNMCVQLVFETNGPYWIEENVEAFNMKAKLSGGVPLNLTFRVVDIK